MPNTPAQRPDRPLATLSTPGDSTDADAIPISLPIVQIGQGPQNDVVLDDDSVSTHHARLEYTDGSWRLIDLESRNGTYVDGVRLAPGVPTPLLDDAMVGFGALKFAFRTLADGDPADVLASYRLDDARKQPTVRRAGFRLPVWLLVLILLFVAALLFLLVWFGGDPQPAAPTMETVSLLADPLRPSLVA